MKRFTRRALCALAVVTALTGCADWKESGTSVKVRDNVYTGMYIDKDHALMVGNSGVTRYSTDGGKRWLAGRNMSKCMYGCNALDEKTLFATGNLKQVIISKNGGDTWTHASELGGDSPLGKSIYFSNAQQGWASSKTWLGETTDGGKTWTQIKLPESVSLIETVCTTSTGVGYLVSGTKEIVRTTDSGAHWETLANPFTALDTPFRPLFALNNQGVALRMDGDEGTIACIGTIEKKNVVLIAKTADGGKSWAKSEIHELKGLPRSVNVSHRRIVSVFNKDTTISRFTL